MSSIQKACIEQQVDLAVAAARLTQYLADLLVEPLDVARPICQQRFKVIPVSRVEQRQSAVS